MAPVLGYWDLRGLAQSIRLLMEYIGLDYEEKRYQAGPAPDFDRSDWMNVKYTLGLPFPNLPYYIDGDVKITQTGTILKYIAMKKPELHLLGETDVQKVATDMLYNQLFDFMKAFGGVVYNPDFENLKAGWTESLPAKFQEIENFIGDKQFSAGDKVTYIDFVLYEVLDVQLAFNPGCLDAFPKLKGVHGRIAKLDKIAAYLKSERCIKGRINYPIAKWGTK